MKRCSDAQNNIFLSCFSLFSLLGMHDWNHEWHNWRFKDLPRDYWKKKTNQKEYMVWLGKKLGLKSTEV